MAALTKDHYVIFVALLRSYKSYTSEIRYIVCLINDFTHATIISIYVKFVNCLFITLHAYGDINLINIFRLQAFT